MKLPVIAILILVVSALSGCATTANTGNNYSDPKDPLEKINRKIWVFNWDYLDKYIAKPASQAYVNYTPEIIREGAYNVALNLNEPSTIINNLLQLKFTDAAKSTGRFVLNTTVGLLGFFDPATSVGWRRNEEEFGEVLGSYGVGDGPFLMLPALGPSSVREEVGDYVDKLYWPLAVIDFWPNVARVTVMGLEKRAQLAEQESLITQSLDPYSFVKNAYFQNMEFKVYDGKVPAKEKSEEDKEFESYLDNLDE
jgi:phospholipid-binding lipoprotein MlaA